MFVWQGFGSRKDYHGSFCKKLPEASPVSDRANATGSKTDLSLAKAEPTSNCGSASGIIYFRRGKNCCAIAAGKEE